jgi:hypothetical protein
LVVAPGGRVPSSCNLHQQEGQDVVGDLGGAEVMASALRRVEHATGPITVVAFRITERGNLVLRIVNQQSLDAGKVGTVSCDVEFVEAATGAFFNDVLHVFEDYRPDTKAVGIDGEYPADFGEDGHENCPFGVKLLW